MPRSAPAIALLVLAPVATAAAADTPPTERLPTIEARAAGLERHDGLVPFYWDARRGRLLLEVSRWDEELLYGSGLAGGAGILEASLDRGQLSDLGLVRFERVGPRVLLHRRQTDHRSGVSDPESVRAVEESFPSSILAALEVVAEEGRRVLVDATDFLLRDTEIVPALKRSRLGDWKQDASRSALHLERSGAFPRNTEIEAVLTFTADEPARAVAAVLPDGRTLSLRVHHTFLKLPEAGFEPRLVDPRIGFIPQRHKDYGAPVAEPLERHLASRWRLVKKDPQAAVSEPVEPIVFHLDRGMPEPERSAVRAAALWWNHAFEAAGFRNALVVRDLPEGATLLDARYSGIEWIHRAERGWSVGDFRVDPRSGEILHAVARIDSHRRRTTARMWRNLKPSDDTRCQAAEAPDLAWLAADAPDVDEETLVLQRLAYLSAHEVGHTLGLMHNWAATTFGWGSVMDYLGPHIEVKDGALDLSDAYPKDVGAYDRLMIQWGYSPAGDRGSLDRIVRDGYARGLVYPLDGDPRWAEYDWGPDPVQWLATTQAVRRVILERFGAGQLEPGTPVHDLQGRFNLAYLYHRFGIQAAQQHVGGQYQTNAVAGDGQIPVAWVPPAKQRQALDLLMSALAPAELDVPDRILAVLVPAPSGFRETRERFPSEAGGAFSLLSAARVLAGLVVHPLLVPDRAARLSLAEDANALRLPDVLGRLTGTTWHAAPASTPRHAALRRLAQRVVLDGLLDLAAAPEASPEVRAATVAELRRLRVAVSARRDADPVAEAHLRLAESDLAAFLDHGRLERPPAPRLSPPPGRPIG